MCICIFHLIGGNWGPEYSGLRSLQLCQKTWQTIPKDSLSLNRLSFWTVIWIVIKWTINHSSLNRKELGVRYHGLGSLPPTPIPPSSIQKDSLSLNRLSYWTVIWKFIILTINHFSLNRKGWGVRFHDLGSLPPWGWRYPGLGSLPPASRKSYTT